MTFSAGAVLALKGPKKLAQMFSVFASAGF